VKTVVIVFAELVGFFQQLFERRQNWRSKAACDEPGKRLNPGL